MLEYVKIDFSEEIYVNKVNGLCNCIICHYWYFVEIYFRFQQKVYDSCHDLMQKLCVLMVWEIFLI